MKYARELLAAALVLATLIGIPAVALHRAASRAGLRIVSLTGVRKDGVWTDEVVDGTNYWRQTFRRATVTLALGEEIILRLQSADVTHGFYVPELGVGPVLVEPGRVVEVRLRGTKAGELTYYCTAVCGRCHYSMKGTVRVLANDAPPLAAASPSAPCNHAQAQGAPPSALVDRGAFLFATMGCETCHGPRGSGGVVNFNYLKDTVPQNNLIAERMQLFEREDVDTVIALIDQQADLSKLEEDPPFRTYARFLAQYQAVRELIRNGNPAGKKDPLGPQPPLNMPSWRYQLTERDIDALISFLLSQFPWGE